MHEIMLVMNVTLFPIIPCPSNNDTTLDGILKVMFNCISGMELNMYVEGTDAPVTDNKVKALAPPS